MNSKTSLDIISTVVEKGIDAANNFLQKLIGPAVDEVGLLVADSVRFWRFKNQLNILNKAQKHIENKGISMKKVPLKNLIPLLEGCSLEEDEDLKEKWAALLVNSVDAEKDNLPAVFSSLLAQIGPKEAKWLDYLKAMAEITWSSLPISNAEVYNLLRLGLIREERRDVRPAEVKEMMSNPNGMKRSPGHREFLEKSYTRSYLRLTELGKLFVEACT